MIRFINIVVCYLILVGGVCLIYPWEEASAAKLELIKTVEIGKNRELLVNNRPFFPIMSWAQSTCTFGRLKGLGFNTFCGSGKSAGEALESAVTVGGYAIPHFSHFAPALKGHPGALAWALQDEPDLGIGKGQPRVAPEQVANWYRKSKEQDPTRPVFLNYTSWFMKYESGDKPDVKAYYSMTSKAADILSFDIYPIYQLNRDDKLTLVADGVSQLLEYAGPGKPVWAWIETSKGSRWITYEKQKDVTPAITRSEVWMAIIRGATGIGYFTHAWRPRFTEFAPTPEMQMELKRTNMQLARLCPIILSGPSNTKASIAFQGGLYGEIMVREHNGYVYFFANNLDMNDVGEAKDDVKAVYRGGIATITADGLKDGSRVEVVDEDRSIVVVGHKFSDKFDPLEVHIYRYKK